MADLPSTPVNKITDVQVATDAPLTESTLRQIGIDINSLLDRPSFLNSQAFTSNGTFTVPTGVTRIFVQAAGGGGGAGGSQSGTNGGGGGASGECLEWFQDITGETSLAITVGTGGVGGIGSPLTSPANGTDSVISGSSFTLRAFGGLAGGNGLNAGPVGAGGVGQKRSGSASSDGGSGGSSSSAGMQGQSSILFSSTGGSGNQSGGGGGASIFANGGGAGAGGGVGSGVNGSAGSLGSGGGGAGAGGAAAANGGAGGNGKVIIYW